MGARAAFLCAMARYEPHDKFYHKARERGLRSRAAFKLEELIGRFGLVHKGARVADLGCAPGGWLVILAQAVGSNGRVVGIDIDEVKSPASNVVTIAGDIRDNAVQAFAIEKLGGRADLVTSDLAPKLSGIAERDEARVIELMDAAMEFARSALKPGGAMLAKVFMGRGFDPVVAEFRRHFSRIEITRPKASRPGSSELYLLGINFRQTD